MTTMNPAADLELAVRQRMADRGYDAQATELVVGKLRERLAARGEATPKVAPATPDVAEPGFWGRAADTGNAFTIGMAQRVPGVLADLATAAQAGEAAMRNPARAILPALGSAIDFARNPTGTIGGIADRSIGDAARAATADVAPLRGHGLASAALGGLASWTGAVAQGVNAAAMQAVPARALDQFTPEGIAYSSGQSMVDMGASIGGGIVGGLTAGPVGAAAGAFLPTLASEAGSNLRQNLEAIKAQNPGIGEEDALTLAFVPAVAAAIPSAALDAMSGGEAAVARELVETAARRQAQSVMRRLGGVAKGAVRSAAEEGLTEPIQGTLSDLGQKIAAPGGGPTTGEDVADFARRRAAEALTGAVMGGVAGGGAKVPGMFRGQLSAARASRGAQSENNVNASGTVAYENELRAVRAVDAQRGAQTITPFPGTVGGIPSESQLNPNLGAESQLGVESDRIATLIDAIANEPDEARAAALARELDALVSPEGLAVADVPSPNPVENGTVNFDPAVSGLPFEPPRNEVGGGTALVADEGISSRGLAPNNRGTNPVGDVAGRVQSQNPSAPVGPSSTRRGTSSSRTKGTATTPTRPSEPTSEQTGAGRPDIASMPLADVRAELESLGHPTGGTRAAVLKRLEEQQRGGQSLATQPSTRKGQEPSSESGKTTLSTEPSSPTPPSRTEAYRSTLSTPERMSSRSSPNSTPREENGYSDSVPTRHADDYGNFTKYGDAVDPSGNWKRLKDIPEDGYVALYHATSKESARGIMREGYRAAKSAFTDTPPDYVYMGGWQKGAGGLGTYIGHQGKGDPALVVFRVKKSDLEADKGTDWKSMLKGRDAKADIRRLHPGESISDPPAWLTYAAINQVRAHKSVAEPIGWIDPESGKFTPREAPSKPSPPPRQPTQEPAGKPSEAKRGRPKTAVVFEKPIEGKTGAKLTGYEWRWKEEAYVDERSGEEVTRRESDWDESQTNMGTGREIVHLFSIERADGTTDVVSLESALRELGYLGEVDARPVRNLASSLKTLAKNKMELAQMEREWEPLEDARVRASELAFPADKIKMELRDPFSKEAKARGERKVVWSVDGAEVTGETVEAGKSPPSRIPDERRMTLESEWRNTKAIEIGGKDAGWYGKRSVLAGKIRDVRQRIAKLEKKLAVSDAPSGDGVGGVGQSLRPADGATKTAAAVVTKPGEKAKAGGRAPVKMRTFRTKEQIAAEKANRVHRPFSKADLESRIAEAYDSTPNAEVERSQDMADNESAGDAAGSGMFKFHGPLPADVLQLTDGRPQLRRMLLANVKGGTGSDYLAQMGGDRWLAALERANAAKLPKYLEGLRNSPDPEHQFLAAIYDNLPATKNLPPKNAVKADTLPAGTRFKINGEEFEVMTDANGYRVLKDGKEYPVVPVEMLDEIPVDKGTMKNGKARAINPEPYKSEKVSQSARDLLGNEIAEPITGSQREMILGHEGAKVDGPKREGVDAKIAEKFDDNATDPLFDPMIAKLAAAEAAARARIAQRQIPRKGKGRSGATTIPQDLIDHAHILAIRMARAGVKTFKAAMEMAQKYIGVEAPERKAQTALLARRAFAVVRKAKEEGGAIDAEAVDRMIREEVEKRGEKAGREMTTRELSAKMQEMAKTLREGARTQAKTVAGLQREFVRLARQNVPLPVRGKLLAAVANAKTFGTMARGIAQARNVLVEYEARRTLAKVKADTRRSSLLKLTNDLRKTIVGSPKPTTKGASGLFETARIAYETAMDPKSSIDDRETALRELMHVSDTIKAAIHQHRIENKIREKEQWADVRVARARVQAAARRGGNLTPEVADPRDGKPQPNVLARFFRHLMDTESFAMLLDGDWTGKGPSRTILYDNLREGKTRQQERVLRAMEVADKVARDVGGYDNFGDFMAAASGTIGKSAHQIVELSNPIGGRKKITLGQAMKILAMDQETQMQAAKGRRFNWDDDRAGDEFELTGNNFADVRAAVPGRTLAMIDALKAIRESMREDMFKVVLEIKGYEPVAVYGYEPRRTNPEKVKIEGFDGITGDTDRHLEDLGITKDRLENATIPLLLTDFGSDWVKSIEQMTAIIELAHPLRNARMVYLNNPPGTTSTAAAIANRFGDGAMKRIDRLLKDIGGSDKREIDGLDRLVLALTRNTSRALTSVNPRSWMKNLGGIIKAMGEAEAGVVARGVARMGRKGLFEDMLKHSAYLKHRYSLSSSQLAMGLPTSVDSLASWKVTGRAAASDLAALNVRDLFGKSLPALIDHIRIAQWFDAAAARALWAGYELDPRGRNNPAWVAEQVERVMRRTANSSDVMDLSGLSAQYRKSAFGAPFLAFTSDANRSYNMLVRGFGQSKEKGAKAALAIVGNALFSSAVTGLLGQGVYSAAAAAGGDDKEAEKRAEKAMADAAWNFVAELASPVMADRLVHMARASVEGWAYDSGTDTPLSSQVSLTLKGGVGVVKEIAGAFSEASPKKRQAAMDRLIARMGDVAQGTMSLAGIPGANVVRQTKKAIDLATN